MSSQPDLSSTLVFLQNAWSPAYAGGEWPRLNWLRALGRSRSGKRLQIMFGERYELRQCWNTTPIVGPASRSRVPPSPSYVVDILEREKPKRVVACGKQAAQVLAWLWRGPLLIVPHPAARVLTNALYEEAKTILEREEFEPAWRDRIALIQRRGSVGKSACVEPSLRDVLSLFGGRPLGLEALEKYKHAPGLEVTQRNNDRAIVEKNQVVFVGTAGEVWKWLRER